MISLNNNNYNNNRQNTYRGNEEKKNYEKTTLSNMQSKQTSRSLRPKGP